MVSIPHAVKLVFKPGNACCGGCVWFVTGSAMWTSVMCVGLLILLPVNGLTEEPRLFAVIPFVCLIGFASTIVYLIGNAWLASRMMWADDDGNPAFNPVLAHQVRGLFISQHT